MRCRSMPNRTYSMVTKLAGAALAKVKGADAAAAELRVDKRTVARWLNAAPEDGWTLARDLAQARLQEQLATGKLSASMLATVAGIADRNVRYGELLRQREARKAAEAETEPQEDADSAAFHRLVDSVPPERIRLLADALRLDMQRDRFLPDAEHQHPAEPMAQDEYWAQLTAEVERLRDLTDEQFRAARVDLDAAIAAQAAKVDQKFADGIAEQRASLERPLSPAIAVPPPEPPKPQLVVVEDGPNVWQPLYREKF
jgi:hypothetical protein